MNAESSIASVPSVALDVNWMPLWVASTKAIPLIESVSPAPRSLSIRKPDWLAPGGVTIVAPGPELPDPTIVRSFVIVTLSLYVPDEIRIVSPAFAAFTAAWIVVNEPKVPVWSTIRTVVSANTSDSTLARVSVPSLPSIPGWSSTTVICGGPRLKPTE